MYQSRNYLSLELECSGFNDNGVFKLEHKLKDISDTAQNYARSKGYTTLATGMSFVVLIWMAKK